MVWHCLLVQQIVCYLGFHCATTLRNFGLIVDSCLRDDYEGLSVLRETTLCVGIGLTQNELCVGTSFIVSEQLENRTSSGVFLLVLHIFMLYHKNVDCVSVRRTSKELRLVQIVEHKRVDVRVCSSTTHFEKGHKGLNVATCLLSAEKSNNRTSFTRCGQEFSCFAQNNCFNCSVVGLKDIVCVLRTVVGYAHVAFLTGRCGKDGSVFTIGVQGAETFGIIACVNCINEAQVGKIVDIHTIFKNNNNSKYYLDRSYLSFRSLTAITLVLKVSSPIAFCWWSSQSITLLGGNLGYVPPPTRAKMLHLKSISTIPMPP